MGRGHKGVINQSKIKGNNTCERHREEDKPMFLIGLKKKRANLAVVDLPEDFLNELRQMNPSVLAKTLMKM